MRSALKLARSHWRNVLLLEVRQLVGAHRHHELHPQGDRLGRSRADARVVVRLRRITSRSTVARVARLRHRATRLPRPRPRRIPQVNYVTTTGSGSSTTRLGLNGGAGLSFGLPQGSALFLESRYVTVFTKNQRTNYWPLVGGIRWTMR